ncbi:MAG: NnrU family protein [Hyphomonas sp.]|nr:NnrU family protein [Nitrospira sp.]
MAIFILGLVIFFGAHVFSAVRSREPGKDLKQKMGYGPYMGAYTFVSVVGFFMICYGFNATRGMGLVYAPPSWGRHINFALMPPAFILLIASQLPVGRIKKWAKHPMLVAVKLWAFGHFFATGQLNAFLLFTAFLSFAIFDRVMVKRRGDNGPAADTPVKLWPDVASVIGGIVLYVGFVGYLHAALIGVPVILPR